MTTILALLAGLWLGSTLFALAICTSAKRGDVKMARAVDGGGL